MEREKTILLATEKYASLESWNYELNGGALERKIDGKGTEGTLGNSLTGVFKSVFLPQGYPDSVSQDYLQYQFWDTLQAFASSLSGTLATQASLRGVGVGNQEATVAAATITWLLRDGTGMLGRILFAWHKGNKLDSEAKKWRLFADVLNDIAMFMEILAPIFPTCFTVIVCTAGVFKSVVGVAGGATRAALTMHQARRDNMADISAKDGSQETLVNLAGLLISLGLIPLVTDNPPVTFILFSVFTILHLFANYKAVRSVVMETLNEARLNILLRQYLSDGRVLSPQEANRREPVFLEFRGTAPVRLGVRLGEFVSSYEDLQAAMKNSNRPFLIGVKHGCVCVCLGPEASVCDEIWAMCQALCISTVLRPVAPLEGALKQLSISHGEKKDHWDLVYESDKLMDQIFQPFLKGLEEAGWQMSRNLLDWDEWRVEWKKKSS
ncbi:RUS1 family protein C16orf58 homolog [Hypomesus transpacificus]|uniref:RUS1 family protein C16orf58 homolog n=1 Tax=Hypomesus transpacificus TaxID=137520 RepID=UPI001F083F2D|nr:RUS1 family protein C16orf58 homolog [Hypomesus transpacificus]